MPEGMLVCRYAIAQVERGERRWGSCSLAVDCVVVDASYAGRGCFGLGSMNGPSKVQPKDACVEARD
jgi:hypothetical protein